MTRFSMAVILVVLYAGAARRIGVLCRRPSDRFNSSGRYNMHRTGNAHGRVAKGTILSVPCAHGLFLPPKPLLAKPQTPNT
jgi:hypothetical protein